MKEGLTTMNIYSRGHLFFVHPGGIIRYWAPRVRDVCRDEYPKVIEKLRSTFVHPNTEAAE